MVGRGTLKLLDRITRQRKPSIKFNPKSQCRVFSLLLNQTHVEGEITPRFEFELRTADNLKS